MAEGRLPALQEIFEKGVNATLHGPRYALAEVVQTLVVTGCPPEQTHYWGIHSYDASAYDVRNGGVYDNARRKPFFALGPVRRVAAIDLPQYTKHAEVNGWQVRNWGTHAAMTPTDSSPPEAVGILDAAAGVPPIRTHTYTTLRDAEDMKRMLADLHEGMEIRARMLEFLIKQGDWDLVLTPFAELHEGGHYFLPNADSLEVLGKDDPWAPLLGLYVHLDSVVERLRRAAPDWNISVFSVEGLHHFSDEPHNTFLLPELLLRDSFGGRGAFVFEDAGRGPSPEEQAGIQNWVMEAWHQRRRVSPWQTRMRVRLGVRWSALIEAKLGLALHPEHPASVPHCDYQPAMWVRKYWPHMRAFALPTFSDGFVRINVRGRERSGLIPPHRFADECDRIAAVLEDLRDPCSGRRAVREIHRARDHAFQPTGERPTADLVVQWNEPGPGNCLESSSLGRLGPVRSLRASIHRPIGFLGAAGPDVPTLGHIQDGSALDIAPTLLALIQADPPEQLPGRVLFGKTDAAMACR